MWTWLRSLYLCGHQERKAKLNEREKESNECCGGGRMHGKITVEDSYTFLCHKFHMKIRTLGISALIKMFDLYSFFISFVPRLFPFCCIPLLYLSYHFVYAFFFVHSHFFPFARLPREGGRGKYFGFGLFSMRFRGWFVGLCLERVKQLKRLRRDEINGLNGIHLNFWNFNSSTNPYTYF